MLVLAFAVLFKQLFYSILTSSSLSLQRINILHTAPSYNQYHQYSSYCSVLQSKSSIFFLLPRLIINIINNYVGMVPFSSALSTADQGSEFWTMEKTNAAVDAIIQTNQLTDTGKREKVN